MAVLAVLAIGIDDVQTVRAQGMNILVLAAHAVPMVKRLSNHS